MPEDLFDRLGGMPALEKVHTIFYDKLLSHPWLKDLFKGVPRPQLETQQSGFMSDLFGGPLIYGGRLPISAQMHIYITEEIFLLRHELLAQSLTEAKIRPDFRERWPKHGMDMKPALVKESVAECEGCCKSEPIIVVEKPG